MRHGRLILLIGAGVFLGIIAWQALNVIVGRINAERDRRREMKAAELEKQRDEKLERERAEKSKAYDQWGAILRAAIEQRTRSVAEFVESSAFYKQRVREVGLEDANEEELFIANAMLQGMSEYHSKMIARGRDVSPDTVERSMLKQRQSQLHERVMKHLGAEIERAKRETFGLAGMVDRGLG